jgi:hypothetical protein
MKMESSLWSAELDSRNSLSLLITVSFTSMLSKEKQMHKLIQSDHKGMLSCSCGCGAVLPRGMVEQFKEDRKFECEEYDENFYVDVKLLATVKKKNDFPYHRNHDCNECDYLEEMREEDNCKWACFAPKAIESVCTIRKTYKR